MLAWVESLESWCLGEEELHGSDPAVIPVKRQWPV
jgi:hypothetical protein